MTSATTLEVQPGRPARVDRPRLWWEVVDAWTIAKRNLRAIPRNPDLLLDVTLQPIVLVLIFGVVFGGAIQASVGGSYVNYLMAGIFVQTAIFGAMTTAGGLADDLQKGLLDRFRSMPMGRSSVMVGRALSDLLRSLLAIVVMIAVGLLIGFSPSGSVMDWLAGLGLLLAFTFAASWIGVVIALVMWRNPVAVQSVFFIVVFPLTFISSAFVPVATLPGWLQGFAANQPVSQLVDALRALILGQPVGDAPTWVLAWTVGMVLVGIMLSARLYRNLSDG
jgi:ABC-2 type transport system permease protein/oleandomycin transport system permease protein